MKQNNHSVASGAIIEGEIIESERGSGAVRRSVLLHSPDPGRSVALRKSGPKRHAAAPVVSISLEDAQRIIDAAGNDRDRLLLTVLWQTGCRVSEALELRGSDIEPAALYLRNLKNGAGAHKLVPLPAGSTLAAELALWQKQHKLTDNEPLFSSQKGGRLSRYQAWRIVKAASERAGVTVRAIRQSGGQEKGDRVGAWSHVFRHSRAVQTLRYADPVTAQQVLGHANLQTTSRYLRYDQAELARKVSQVPG